MRKVQVLIGLTALLASAVATADNGVGLHLAATLGLSVGGDKLATINYTSGDSQQITAGGLLYLAAGPALVFKGTPFSVQAMLGYQVDDSKTNTSGADIKFDRTTLDLMGFYRFGNHRLGAGIYQAMSPTLSNNSFYDSNGHYYAAQHVDFNGAIGPALEYNYLPGRGNFGFSVRAVKVSYTPKSEDGMPIVGAKSVDGSFLGVGLYLYL